MSYAQNYTPVSDFSQDETNNISGRSTVKTSSIDTEFTNIATSINALNNNLKILQRSDGALKNGIVTVGSLSSTVLLALNTLESAIALEAAVVDAQNYSIASENSSQDSYTYSVNSGNSAATSTAQAVISTTQAGLSTTSAVAAQMAQIESELARDESVAAKDAVVGYRNVFETTAKALSKGVSGVAEFSGGSGGTNGTFALSFTGGGGTGAAGTFTVTSGYVASVNITASGDSYTSVPALGFSASAGLTGATATAIIANNVDVNEYFAVPSSVVGESVILYKNNAGSALEITRFLNNSIVQAQIIDQSGHLVVKDSAGNILIDIGSTVILHPVIESLLATQSAAAVPVAAIKYAIGAPQIDVSDPSDNLLIRVTPTDIEHPKITALQLSATTANNKAGVVKRLANSSQSSAYAFLASVVHWLLYGQSLSVGTNSGGGINLTAIGSYAKMPNGGIFWREDTTDPAVGFSSLTNMLETVRETGMVAAVKMLVQLLTDEDGIDFSTTGQTIIGTSAGVGSTDIAQLLTTYYSRVTEDFTQAKARCDDLNKSYSVSALFYIQGESDYSHGTTRAAYLTSLRTMQTTVQATAQTVSGLTKSTPMLTYQTSCHYAGTYARATPDIALAQLAAALNEDSVNALITMATPSYFFPYSNDGIHMVGIGYDWMLAYFGLAVKRWFFDGVKPLPLVPSVATAFGKTVVLRFQLESGKKLVIDTTTVAAQTNYGFQVADSGGSALTISTVAVLQDRVEIRLSATVPTGAVVRYGWVSTTGGYLGLGNIRDNTGDTLIYDPTGLNKPLHKWLPIFEKVTTT